MPKLSKAYDSIAQAMTSRKRSKVDDFEEDEVDDGDSGVSESPVRKKAARN